MNFDQLVLASGNKGKVAEFNSLFGEYGIKVTPQSAFDIPDVPETGTTFVENAIIKARHAASLANMPAIADDSGLVVEALHGAPGIYSARYAGVHGDNEANNAKLLKTLDGIDNRQAKFLCVLVFMRSADDPTPIICQGEWHGNITQAASGSGGFGYDPVFYVQEHNCTAAELDKSVKNRESHRGKALKQLMPAIQSLLK
ncbi:RdgB/HAM1 family non-canonical purine NTP pyrophosphatase [Agaribacter marinus]|uniref:dITP/XTP pyrophosphatase n=1 Tax=Agaribacter marinus TaxID=1431249 RepID=A0AA37WK24_9ALTE|nr:RdgB/HAM1 family non-canonical purine NTP pyrophosphatase [Agaribacter marinus]GLR72917.1 non-canonical purine NTP pyrophosphatase [Agaribacter marinus]